MSTVVGVAIDVFAVTVDWEDDFTCSHSEAGTVCSGFLSASVGTHFVGRSLPVAKAHARCFKLVEVSLVGALATLTRPLFTLFTPWHEHT